MAASIDARRRAGDDLDATITPVAAAAMCEELAELASGGETDIAPSEGPGPHFPFGPDQSKFIARASDPRAH